MDLEVIYEDITIGMNLSPDDEEGLTVDPDKEETPIEKD